MGRAEGKSRADLRSGDCFGGVGAVDSAAGEEGKGEGGGRGGDGGVEDGEEEGEDERRKVEDCEHGGWDVGWIG